MPVNVEFVGGPMDGQQLTFPDDMLDHYGEKMPGHIALTGDGVHVAISADPAIDAGHGRYDVTRKITRAGRLIYEFRPKVMEARS